MRTITKTFNVFSFGELSDEAKERAHEAYLERSHEYSWSGEVRDTIEAFEREFDVEIYNWRYDADGYDFDLRFCGWNEDALALKGNRARSYIWNHYEPILLTGRYYSKPCNLLRGGHYSRFWHTRVYDGTCPWTGVCYDCNALDPLAYFAFGVMWDEEAKRRVPIRPTIAEDDSRTVEGVIRDCVHSLFAAAVADCEYQNSMEAFEQDCEANGYEFTEDGEMYAA